MSSCSIVRIRHMVADVVENHEQERNSFQRELSKLCEERDRVLAEQSALHNQIKELQEALVVAKAAHASAAAVTTSAAAPVSPAKHNFLALTNVATTNVEVLLIAVIFLTCMHPCMTPSSAVAVANRT